MGCHFRAWLTRQMLGCSDKKTYGDDRGRDLFGGIDDLPDARHSQCDVHGCHARKVERLQRHLCARLSDTLRPKRTDCGSCQSHQRMTKETCFLWNELTNEFQGSQIKFGLEMTCSPIAALAGYSTFLYDQRIVRLLQMCSNLQGEETEATVRIRMYLGPSSFHHSGKHKVERSSGSVLDSGPAWRLPSLPCHHPCRLEVDPDGLSSLPTP